MYYLKSESNKNSYFYIIIYQVPEITAKLILDLIFTLDIFLVHFITHDIALKKNCENCS